MLMRVYLAVSDLQRYSALMLDEAHGRTLQTDVLFGLRTEVGYSIHIKRKLMREYLAENDLQRILHSC